MLKVMRYAVIPVKAFSLGKQRLAPWLSAEQRRGLSQAMCADVLATLVESGKFGRIILLGNDTSLKNIAADVGAELVLEAELGSCGLNASLDALCQRLAAPAGAQRAQVLIAHSDLPMLSISEIHTVLDSLQDSPLVLVADRHGRGSNILARDLAVPFAAEFGEMSLEKHQLQAQARGLACRQLNLAGASWDIDQPADLQQAIASCAEAFGPHSREFLCVEGLLGPSAKLAMVAGASC